MYFFQTSFLSAQRFQKAGVQFEHDAIESLVRFLLLTFRLVSYYVSLLLPVAATFVTVILG